MLSLLNLPDEALFTIGTYLEPDISDLGLFLLIHPRINKVCYALRHRHRKVRLTHRSPLGEYLKHPLWLSHVHAINIVTAVGLPLQDFITDLVGASEHYDERLASVISSMRSIRDVSLEVPDKLRVELYNVCLPKTLAALQTHHEVVDFRLKGFTYSRQLREGLNLARSLPACAVLNIYNDAARHLGGVSLLVDYLANSSAVKTLRSLTLIGLRLSAQEDPQRLLQLPQLPLLKHLSIQDNKLWHDGERRSEVDFLAELLKKASNIRVLEMLKPAMHGLARCGVTPTPLRMHLQCPRTSGPPLVGWGAIYPSVTSLTLSGPGAPGAAWSILDMDMHAPLYPFANLQSLILIDSIGWVSRPEYDSMAEEQGIALQVLEHFPDYSKARSR
jgi:hypothetical protein